ncbi:MAG: hypothetical protein U0270_00425 [Labilithrix sp.]
MSRPSLRLSAGRAALVAGVVSAVPPIAYVTMHSSVHWPAMLAIGAVCAVAAGACFGLYFRFASALVERHTLPRRMRVAAAAAPSGGLLTDPLEEEDLALEARFAELEELDDAPRGAGAAGAVRRISARRTDSR